VKVATVVVPVVMPSVPVMVVPLIVSATKPLPVITPRKTASPFILRAHHLPEEVFPNQRVHLVHRSRYLSSIHLYTHPY
jgi:hypothetical protein